MLDGKLGALAQRYFDCVLAVFIYVTVSIVCGALRRYPFDDEVFTLTAIAAPNLASVAHRVIAHDSSPPLSYVIFAIGAHMGLGLRGLRIISLVCMAVSIAIWDALTVDEIPAAAQPERVLQAIVFGMTPLALGMGAALRPYAVFAAFAALAYLIYLRAGRLWFLSAIPLGLAADTTYIAVAPLIAILVHRYAVERQFDWKEDSAFLLSGALLAIPGFAMVATIVQTRLLMEVGQQLASSRMSAVLGIALGFFGGRTLGLSQAWMVVLGMTGSVYFCVNVVFERKQDGARRRLCDLIVISVAAAMVFPLLRAEKAYWFLFMAPMISAMVVLGSRSAFGRAPLRASVALAFVIALGVAVAGNLRYDPRPYKREAAVPFDLVDTFLRLNGGGSTIIATSDPTVSYLATKEGVCVSTYAAWSHSWLTQRCAQDHAVHKVIVVGSYPGEGDLAWNAGVIRLISGKALVGQVDFGTDYDVNLKTRLTGAHLSRDTLTVGIYR